MRTRVDRRTELVEVHVRVDLLANARVTMAGVWAQVMPTNGANLSVRPQLPSVFRAPTKLTVRCGLHESTAVSATECWQPTRCEPALELVEGHAGA